jgi:deoxyribodipyrimidine photo-lyase
LTEPAPVIVWFRNDLRVADHQALADAAATGAPVVPLYILDTRPGAMPGGAACWWLHHSLGALAKSLHARGTSLVLRRGDPEAVLPQLAAELGASDIFWNRRFEPGDSEQDQHLAKLFGKQSIKTTIGRSGLLQSPDTLSNKSGQPYHVFTPFWRALRALDPGAPVAAPKALRPVEQAVATDRLSAWRLLPTKPDWATGFAAEWVPGETAAAAKVQQFLDDPVNAYPIERNRPDHAGTSRLSPHLHWGEVSVRQVWAAALHRQAATRHRHDSASETFLAELGWREFSHHLLFHHPDLPDAPMRSEFERFPWRRSRAQLHAWQRGMTGYPIVDAGMRQLWSIGWMHNRVRMIVASFLTKHLLQPWQDGAAWFMDTLVDADLAANAANWQWVAGCGADAAPYFRIFNPILQGQKFDPEGEYVRRWVPDLRRRAMAQIHEPLADNEVCEDYPQPLVDHAEARKTALAAFAAIRR